MPAESSAAEADSEILGAVLHFKRRNAKSSRRRNAGDANKHGHTKQRGGNVRTGEIRKSEQSACKAEEEESAVHVKETASASQAAYKRSRALKLTWLAFEEVLRY